jgi:hypothetical protein
MNCLVTEHVQILNNAYEEGMTCISEKSAENSSNYLMSWISKGFS